MFIRSALLVLLSTLARRGDCARRRHAARPGSGAAAGLAGAHRLRLTHRLLLRLDEAARRVRVTEQFFAFDASVGARGAALRWHTGMGRVFSQVERQRVFGLQFGPDGQPTGDLTCAWRFDLNELKSPFIDAVTGAG